MMVKVVVMMSEWVEGWQGYAIFENSLPFRGGDVLYTYVYYIYITYIRARTVQLLPFKLRILHYIT